MSTFRPDGVCGNNEWDLTVGADEREWHYGPAEAYGACDGGYYDCSNYYNDQGYIFGNKQFSDDGPDESQGEDVHWSLDDWSVSYQSCNNGNQNDLVEVDTNTPHDTPEYYVEC